MRTILFKADGKTLRQPIPTIFGCDLIRLASILLVLNMIRVLGFWRTVEIAKIFNAAYSNGTLEKTK